MQVKTNIGTIIKELKSNLFYNEDIIFKRKFLKSFMPALYENHIKDLLINCVFCSNLARSNCHKHCLKCSAGTYIYCSPLLPGIFDYNKKGTHQLENSAIPWFYKKTCKHFNRLDSKNYLRNFIVPFSWTTIYNFEILEGLICGISANEKPCHICATVDYQIYKDCLDKDDFDKYAPCLKIAGIIESRYIPA